MLPPRPGAAAAVPGPARTHGAEHAEDVPAASRTADISWANAHGGAGATTFAAALGGTDIGHAWPDVGRGEPGRTLLLARTHDRGLRAAAQALDALRTGRHPPGVHLVAVVLVADAPGRLPLELFRRVRVLRSAARTISVPWISQWRVGEPVAKAPRAIVELAALIGPAGPTQRDGQ
ncbi:hypothetical protein [Streptomyces sp. NPDC000618]|uniref:hypothetical protein n=1 Tax=unclassified Streptomyces TaxID=2593676 RepID=UPI00331E6455